MNKYTIKNIFERSFPFPIWKIEVDCSTDSLVVEYRDPDSTLPYFAVLDYDGEMRSAAVVADEKEWTLEGLQGDFLILKRFGGASPIEAGIRIIHHPSGRTVCHYMEYVLSEVYAGTIIARHRSVPAGLLYAIDIATGKVRTWDKSFALHYPLLDIKYPLPYEGRKPAFIEEIKYVDHIWLLPFQNLFLWAYHTENGEKYDLQLRLTSKSETFDNKIILKDLTRLIPQPFFQVKDYTFFLSNCKLKIKGYLV